ncbi:MAG: hypothetical protein EZS28_021591 [Streblomastix strix]|uniref:Uncharacterized protein n=1 Tax=Streblomastix strix TaxID=222440 RepID=A0A5J4VKZ6_9EUKA|nr:MAG: hypothetical protein EZS28_021591 [Streblomastix strix]
MTVPKEYNVQGSLNGLGLNILNEVLSGFLYVKDAQNLVGVSQLTYKLKDHPRLMTISETFIHGLNVPNETDKGKTVEEDGQSDGTSFVHTNSNDNWCTVTVDPIVESGISKVEFVSRNFRGF